MCEPLSLGICHVCVHLPAMAKGVRSPVATGPGVTGLCELLDVGAGNRTFVLLTTEPDPQIVYSHHGCWVLLMIHHCFLVHVLDIS